jgi:hypothetical protein
LEGLHRSFYLLRHWKLSSRILRLRLTHRPETMSINRWNFLCKLHECITIRPSDSFDVLRAFIHSSIRSMILCNSADSDNCYNFSEFPCLKWITSLPTG